MYNFLISIVGWALWNLAELQIEKADKDEDGNPNTNLSLSDYAKRHWVLWIGSLLSVPVILWMGYRNIGIDPFGDLLGVEAKGWHDLYILGAGAAFEGFIFGVKKVKKFFAKKTSEL